MAAKKKKAKPRTAREPLDPEALIQQAIQANLDTSVWDRFDDRDIPQAENVIQWSLGSGFMNSGLFTKQAEVLVRLFAEYCPRCSDPDYLSKVPVEGMEGMGVFQERVQLLAFGVCPKCGKNRYDLFNNVIPEELVAVWGQRSGKSITAAAKAATYQLHRFLKIPNVAKYYRQDLSQKFDIVFTAYDKTQAQSTLWSSFSKAHDMSPWFRSFKTFMDQQCQELGVPQQTHVLPTYIYYGGTKNIFCTFKAPNLSSLRGDTRVFTATDELAFMGEKGIRANAEEVYASLSNSLRTIRSSAKRLHERGEFNAPTGMMVNISSPYTANDKMMQLLKEGEIDKAKVTSHLSTWEVNPDLKREDFRSVELTQPIRFLRDFGATPPLGADTFIGAEKNLERVVDVKLKPLFRTVCFYVKDEVSEGRYVGAKLADANMVADKSTPRIVCVDAGETGNSFSIGVYSAYGGTNGVEIGLRVDAVIEVMPEKDTATDTTISVHFPTMSQLIMDICKYYNVLAVVWDRWQSTGEIQRLRDQKILAERYSPRYEDFTLLRGRIWNGTCRAPAPEMGLSNLRNFDGNNSLQVQQNPWTHFYVQCATVRASGKKVLKPQGGEDDMFRTLVLASHYLADPAFAVRMLQAMPVAFQGAVGNGGSRVLVSTYSGNRGVNLGSGGMKPSGSVLVKTRLPSTKG